MVSDYSSFEWTSTGDGSFDYGNTSDLNPTYTFGENDTLNGSVTLTLTATGLGNQGSCPPAESSIIITLNNLETTVDLSPVTCNGGDDGSAVFSAMGGTEPYIYNLDGMENSTGIFSGLAAGIYTYYIIDSIGCNIEGTIEITEPELMDASLSYINVNCFGDDDGSITVSDPVGGSGNYAFRINNGVWQSEIVFTGLAANDYIVEMHDVDAPDCIVVLDTITITQPEELIVIVTGTDPTTPGGTDGTATATVTGGTEPYTYLWDDVLAQTTATASDLTEGTYTVTVTDANGCETDGVVILTDPIPELAVTAIVDQNVSCFGGNDGQATANATGGIPPYTYLWDDPAAQTTATASDLSAGTYTVTVTDTENTEVTDTVIITQPEELIVVVTGTDPTTPGGTDGTATATVTGGTAPYSYLWDDVLAQTTATASDLTEGTYTVTVTDANGCQTDGTVILTDPLAVIAIVDQNVFCYGGNDGQATATATGGIPPYTYLWDDPLLQTTATASDLVAGTYTVTVTDTENTEVTDTVIITQPEELIVVVTGTDPTTPGGTDGTATATVTGGTAPYSYLWDDVLAQTTATASDLTEGIYTVTVTDANGCETDGTIILTDPIPELAVTAIVDQNVFCYGGNDGQATATATGGVPPYTYLWDDPAAQSTATASSLYAGTYTVTVTDSENTEASSTITIIQPELLIVNVTGTDPTTIGGTDGTATATVSGGTVPYTYLWDDPLAQTTSTASDLAEGTYTVIVTDANGCETLSTITLTDPVADLAVTAIVDQNVFCYGGNDGQATATATGGVPPYNYLWDDPAAQSTATATSLYAGTYAVTVTDSENTEASSTITITEPDLLVVFVTGTDPTTIGGNDGTATAAVSGGTEPYTYLWDDALAQTTSTASDLTEGTYTVTVTDANGCETTGTVSLTDPLPELAVTAAVNQHVFCYGGNDGRATATATGGVPPYIYLWDDPAAQTTATATGLVAGTYTVTVTDAENTEVTATVIITQPEELIVVVTGTDPTTIGGTDGTATATVTGGTEPYSYLWDDPLLQTTSTASDLAEGTYTVTVTDANGCETTGTVILTDPLPELAVTAMAEQHVFCFGGNDGQATATATGGIPPYIYLWDDPAAQTTATATGLLAGTYTVTVTDSEYTEASASITITEPEELIVVVTGTNPTTIGGTDGTATATVTGGTELYTYLWDDALAQTTSTATDLAAGTYSVTVTDANGCQATSSILLTEPPQIICPEDIEVFNDSSFCGAEVIIPIPQVICDNSYVVWNDYNLTNDASDYYPVGTTIVNWYVKDEFGNVDSCNMSVTVIDIEPPDLICPGDYILTPSPEQCEANVDVAMPMIYDNCGIEFVYNDRTGTSDASGVYPLGETVVNWTLIDIHGNINECSCTVIVRSEVVAIDDYAETNEDVAVDIPVVRNDLFCTTDYSLNSLSVVVEPQHGQAMLNAADSMFAYYPDQGFSGTDEFIYRFENTSGFDDIATVTVVVYPVNHPPVATDDYISTDMNIPVSLFPMENDTDPDGDIISISSLQTPFNGSVMQTANEVTYSPFMGYVGEEVLTYVICDDGFPVLCDTATIFITISYVDYPEFDLHVYNALTPNGDGINDTWKIEGIWQYPENEVLIMNRWGELVRTIRNYNNRSNVWDGTNNSGSPLVNGDYYYILKLQGGPVLKGWVYLHR